MWLTWRAIAFVWASAVAGSDSRRARSTSTSTSLTGGLLMIPAFAALAAWKAGTIVRSKVVGLTITEFGT